MKKNTTTDFPWPVPNSAKCVTSAHFSIVTKKSIACCFRLLKTGSNVATKRFTS